MNILKAHRSTCFQNVSFTHVYTQMNENCGGVRAITALGFENQKGRLQVRLEYTDEGEGGLTAEVWFLAASLSGSGSR